MSEVKKQRRLPNGARQKELPSRALVPIVMACVVLLGGCAAQNAYKEGQDLVSREKPADALIKFEEASRLDGSSAEYRIAVIRTRASLVSETLESANKLMASERLEEANAAYQKVLTIQPNNPRAMEGVKAIETSARHTKWFATAQSALAKKDEKTAQVWARLILSEDPRNRKAISMVESLEEATQKISSTALLAESYRKPITIEFKDTPLKTVFEVISRTSGLNFLFDKDVRTDQKTSIFLKNSTIEAAVNLTLLTNQLEQRVLDSNTVLIYPNTQAKQKDYQQLTVRTFYLANAEAKTVAGTLKTILKSRDVVVDDKLNMLIVRDTPEAIRLAEKLVAVHDVADSEVMLEVEILEVKRTRLLDLGIRWPDQVSLSPIAAATGALTVADLRGLNQTTIGATIGSATISANKADTDANILANPRIRVRNREKAKILIGDRVPNITTTSTATGFVGESINYVDVGLKLDVEPTIYLDGEVSIKISLEVSNIISQLQSKSGSVAYQIGTRTAQTVLRLKDGENQVLAGLINNEDRQTGNKVPGIGEIPIFGRLFGNQSDNTTKTEIVLSITPRILRNIQRPLASAIEFDSGTETSLGSRSGSAGLTAPINPPQASTPATPGANPPSSSPASLPQANSNGPVSQSGVNNGGASVGSAGSNLPASSSQNTPAATGFAVLGWQGPTRIKVGEAFSVQLMMQADQQVVSVPMAVGFDARTLQVTSVVEGSFLKQGGAQTSFTSRIDPSGQILMTGTRAGDSGATSLSSVATINLRAIAAPTSESRLQLLTISPVVLGGRGISAPLPAPHVITITP